MTEVRLSQFYVKHLIANLAQRGVDTAAFSPKGLWGSKLSALTVPLSDFLGLCELAQTQLNEPLFALRVGARTLPPTHGVLGLLLQSCATMGEAIKLGYKFQHLTRSGHLSSLRFDQNSAISRLDIQGQDPEVIAPFVEYCHGNLYSIATHLTGQTVSIVAKEIHFQHQPRAPLSQYKQYLNSDKILFGQAENQVVFSRDMVDLPLFLSDGSAKDQLLGEVNRQLREQNQGNSLSQQIKQMLLQQDPFVVLSLEQCSQCFNLSATTVKRRLQDENTHYRQLLDEVRCELACHCLRESEVTMEQVAARIGFSNATAFSRAFKRWEGVSPQQYRQSHS